MKKIIVLFFLLATQFAIGQVPDTVNLYDSVNIRILVKGDTIMMSARQFENLRMILGSFVNTIEFLNRQVDKMHGLIELDSEISTREQDLTAKAEARANSYKKEYDELTDIATRQNNRLEQLLNMEAKVERRHVLRGLAWGACAGIITGLVIGIIVSK